VPGFFSSIPSFLLSSPSFGFSVFYSGSSRPVPLHPIPSYSISLTPPLLSTPLTAAPLHPFLCSRVPLYPVRLAGSRHHATAPHKACHRIRNGVTWGALAFRTTILAVTSMLPLCIHASMHLCIHALLPHPTPCVLPGEHLTEIRYRPRTFHRVLRVLLLADVQCLSWRPRPAESTVLVQQPGHTQ
jgi:hypothetical protein